MDKDGLLVTGAACSSGLMLLRILKENKYYEEHPVGVVVHHEASVVKVKRVLPEAAVYCGDLTDAAFLENVFNNGNYSRVLHIAGIFTSLEISKAAIVHQVKKIILIHTTGMFSQHKKEAIGFKKTEEEVKTLLENNGVDYTILRPTMIFGTKGDGTIERYVNMVLKFPIVPLINKGRSLLQPVYYKDLSEAFYKVLISPEQTKNKAYNLSGEQSVSMYRMHKEIEKHLHKKRLYINIPLWIAGMVAMALKLCSFGRIDKQEAIMRMDEDRDFSHDNATKDFGYSPKSFEKGLQIALNEEYLRG